MTIIKKTHKNSSDHDKTTPTILKVFVTNYWLIKHEVPEQDPTTALV